MRITDQLRAQHSLLRIQLDFLDGLIASSAPSAGVAGAIAMFRETLSAHEELEERVLLPALERAWGGRLHAGEQLEREHREIDRLGVVLAGAPDDLDVARRFVREVRHHLAREERAVFALADDTVGRDELEAGGRNRTRRSVTLR